jgi:putative oxidoreductase
MTAAVLTVHLRNGFFNTANGYEYNLVLAAALFALAGIGAGNWSLDSALGLDLAGTVWALAALAVGVLGASAPCSAAASPPSVGAATASPTPPEDRRAIGATRAHRRGDDESAAQL